MKEIKTNGITILLVEVPEDVTDYRFKTMPDESKQLVGTVYDDSGHKGTCYINEFIPESDWQILGKSTELSEEQMKEILPIYEGAIRGYRIYTQRPDLLTKDIQESYLSLLETNGIVDRFSISEPPENIGNHLVEWEKEYQEEKLKVKDYIVLKRI